MYEKGDIHLANHRKKAYLRFAAKTIGRMEVAP
jgi:hypothetical protein